MVRIIFAEPEEKKDNTHTHTSSMCMNTNHRLVTYGVNDCEKGEMKLGQDAKQTKLHCIFVPLFPLLFF